MTNDGFDPEKLYFALKLTLTEEQLAGIQWMLETLGKIRSKGEAHDNYANARGAHNGLMELLQAVSNLQSAAAANGQAQAKLEEELIAVTRRCETLEMMIEEGQG